jgi:glutamate formiminotransferase
MTKSALVNTGAICIVSVLDVNREEGLRLVDVGNYFTAPDGTKCVITSRRLAEKYHELIGVPVYVYRTHTKRTETK